MRGYQKDFNEEEMFLIKNDIRNWKINAINNLKLSETEKEEKAFWIRVIYRNRHHNKLLRDEDIKKFEGLSGLKNIPYYTTGGFILFQGALYGLINKKYKLSNRMNSALLVSDLVMSVLFF
jgi:hypothetical protein